VNAAARLLDAGAALFPGAGMLRLVAGPLRFEALGEAVSVRAAGRPLFIALVLLGLRVAFLRAQGFPSDAIALTARATVAGVLVAGVLAWFTFLSTTCGGADSYGYVSAAHRLLAGSLVQAEPLAAVLPFEDGIAAATPLGYTPSPVVPHASVPVYPIGLPALMAAAVAVSGPQGSFVVAPLAGLLLVAAVYVAAVRLSGDRQVALAAAALTTVQPVVFTYAIQPMSDVPAASFFVVAIAALAGGTPRPALAGAAAGMALLIRPALAPALFCLGALPSLLQARFDMRSLVAYLVPLTCALLGQVALQWHLYGHPVATGYAEMEQLFALERVPTNLRSHAYWMWQALGAVFLGAAAIGAAVGQPRARVAIAVVVVTVVLPYLPYRTFDHWETLRFLLPALVMLTIAAAWGVITVSRLVAGRAAPLLGAVLIGALCWPWWQWLNAQSVLTMPEHERRYALAGELVDLAAPPDAVVLADLHSGSIRYYSGRESVNWARVPPGALTPTVAALQRSGHAVYLLLDGEEERRQFESRHGSVGSWLPAGQRRTVQLFEAVETAAAR
jgi:hypothetical protein